MQNYLQSLYQVIHWWQRQPRIEKQERDELKRVIDLIEKHTQMAQNKRPREVILSFLEGSGYLKWLANKSDQEAQRQLSYLEQFDKRLKDYEAESPAPSIKGLMQEINMEL